MRKPKGRGAVMAQHAPAEVDGDSQVMRHYRRLEFFPTPPWAARAAAEVVLSLDPGAWDAEDPCCGQGHFAHGLKPYFRTVATADIYDHGWDGQDRVCDFRSRDRDMPPPDWYFMNPPFSLAADFIHLGLVRARRGVAVLARQALMESAGRYELMFGAGSGFVAYAPYIERVAMTLGRWDPRASTATAYAVFVFMTPEARPRQAGAHPIVLPIAPGSKARLTRADDARLFGATTSAPLLERGAA